MIDTPKILVADDEPIVRSIVASCCRKAGYEATLAENASLAWKHAVAASFHLIITDYQMPKMNGVELCGRLRSSERHKNTPVIMITADFHQLDTLSLYEQFRLVATPKPVNVAELTGMIGDLARTPEF